MAESYVLNVEHQGTACGNFCIYQTCEDQDEDIRSLVWFSKTAHPGTNLTFGWTNDYSFVWCEEGALDSGVVFHASEVRKAEPSDGAQSSVVFMKEDGAYHFAGFNQRTPRGRLGIKCDISVPAGEASIGIGMSGNPVFTRLAGPNMNYLFSLHTRYWIAFGDFEEGEVIDLDRMTQSYEIKFPVDQYERSVRFTAGNTWEAID